MSIYGTLRPLWTEQIYDLVARFRAEVLAALENPQVPGKDWGTAGALVDKVAVVADGIVALEGELLGLFSLGESKFILPYGPAEPQPQGPFLEGAASAAPTIILSGDRTVDMFGGGMAAPTPTAAPAPTLAPEPKRHGRTKASAAPAPTATTPATAEKVDKRTKAYRASQKSLATAATPAKRAGQTVADLVGDFKFSDGVFISPMALIMKPDSAYGRLATAALDVVRGDRQTVYVQLLQAEFPKVHGKAASRIEHLFKMLGIEPKLPYAAIPNVAINFLASLTDEDSAHAWREALTLGMHFNSWQDATDLMVRPLVPNESPLHFLTGSYPTPEMALLLRRTAGFHIGGHNTKIVWPKTAQSELLDLAVAVQIMLCADSEYPGMPYADCEPARQFRHSQAAAAMRWFWRDFWKVFGGVRNEDFERALSCETIVRIPTRTPAPVLNGDNAALPGEAYEVLD